VAFRANLFRANRSLRFQLPSKRPRNNSGSLAMLAAIGRARIV